MIAERRGIGKRIVEVIQRADPLDIIRKVALAGMFGSLIEGAAVKNPDGLVAAVVLLFVAGVSGGLHDIRENVKTS